jgi:hypothetical protein
MPILAKMAVMAQAVGILAINSMLAAPAIDQEPLLDTSAPKKPFGQPVSTKRSVGVKNQNMGTGC